MKQHDVVKFHTPYSDEDPRARYVLLDKPEAVRRHAEEFNKKWSGNIPVKVRVEYLGKVGDDGKIVPHGMFLSPIQDVLLADLAVDESFSKPDPEMDARFSGKSVVIRAPKAKGGRYLGRGGFDARRRDALVYDYDRDNVGGQVAQLLRTGMPVEVELA